MNPYTLVASGAWKLGRMVVIVSFLIFTVSVQAGFETRSIQELTIQDQHQSIDRAFGKVNENISKHVDDPMTKYQSDMVIAPAYVSAHKGLDFGHGEPMLARLYLTVAYSLMAVYPLYKAGRWLHGR